MPEFLPGLRCRGRKESEVFGWSRSCILKNFGCQNHSRIFYPTPTSEIQLNRFLHCIPMSRALNVPVEIVQCLLIKQIN